MGAVVATCLLSAMVSGFGVPGGTSGMMSGARAVGNIGAMEDDVSAVAVGGCIETVAVMGTVGAAVETGLAPTSAGNVSLRAAGAGVPISFSPAHVRAINDGEDFLENGSVIGASTAIKIPSASMDGGCTVGGCGRDGTG
jgi:hypothetical protein